MATKTLPQGAPTPTRRKAVASTDTPVRSSDAPPADEATLPMRASAAGWRLLIDSSLSELHSLLDIALAMDISVGNNALVVDLVDIVDDLIDEGDIVRSSGSANDYYGECIRKVHAVLTAAKEIPELSDGMLAVLRSAHEAVTRISDVLDQAEVMEREPFDGSAAHAPEPAACQQDAQRSWRHIVRPLTRQIDAILSAAAPMDGWESAANGGFAKCNLRRAQQLLRANEHLLARASALDYYSRCIMEVQGLVIGARYMPDTAPEQPLVLEAACGLLKRIEGALNDVGLKTDVPPIELEVNERAFMAGKALAADLVEEAIALDDAGDDGGELEASYRGRGVAQNSFALRYLRQVIEQPDLLDGFSAALSCTLAAAGSANAAPEELRSLTFEDCIGGPNTKYISDEVVGSATVAADGDGGHHG